MTISLFHPLFFNITPTKYLKIFPRKWGAAPMLRRTIEDCYISYLRLMGWTECDYPLLKSATLLNQQKGEATDYCVTAAHKK